MDDDWEDDKNDEFDDVGVNNVNKNWLDGKYNELTKQQEPFHSPVDIRKIGQINHAEKKYCEITYLGNGFSDNDFVCDNLVCTKCDCKVNIFKNYMWDNGDKEVKYMFFRNNFARPEKLKEKLIESYGTYAYCCQCFWLNVSEEIVVADSVSGWTCAGHYK